MAKRRRLAIESCGPSHAQYLPFGNGGLVLPLCHDNRGSDCPWDILQRLKQRGKKIVRWSEGKCNKVH